MVTRVSDLSVDELRLLIQETVAQSLADLLRDPDAGLAIRDDLRRELQASLENADGAVAVKPAADVAAELGLRW